MNSRNKLIKLFIYISLTFIFLPNVMAEEVPIVFEAFPDIKNVNIVVSPKGNEKNLTFELYDDGYHRDLLERDNIYGAIINLNRGIYDITANFNWHNESIISYPFRKDIHIDTYSAEIQFRTIVLDDTDYINEIKYSFLSKLGYAEDNVEFNFSSETPLQINSGKIFDLNHTFVGEWNSSKNYSFSLKVDPIESSGRIFAGTFRAIRKSETGYILHLKFPIKNDVSYSLDRASWRIYIPEKKQIVRNLVIKYEETFPSLVYNEGNYRVLQFNNPKEIKNGYYEYDILIHYDYMMPWDTIIIGFFSGLFGMFITLLFERLMSPKIEKIIKNLKDKI